MLKFDLREFACELTSSWPPARVEGRVLATVSGPLPLDPLDPVDLVDPAQNSEKRVFAVKTNDFGKIFGKMTPRSVPKRAQAWARALGPARLGPGPWARPGLAWALGPARLARAGLGPARPGFGF